MARSYKLRTKFAAALVTGVALLLIVRSMSSTSPQLGHAGGKLRPLPTSPNCVSTQAERDSQKMDPLPLLESGAGASLDRIESICQDLGAKVVERTDDYLRAEFRTRIMRYVDDCEWLVVGDQLHFRSASRVGHWDMGVNRRRMNRIGERYVGSTEGS